jgi:hypothetical protein
LMIKKTLSDTLLIQKFILRLSTSTGIPIAAARLLEVQLKVENVNAITLLMISIF